MVTGSRSHRRRMASNYRLGEEPIGIPKLPGALGPLTASYDISARPGAAIAAITGLASGEFIEQITPTDGCVQASADGASLVVGDMARVVAPQPGTLKYRVWTSSGRQFQLDVVAGTPTPTPLSRYPLVAAARAANQRAPIGFIGDSLTAGFGSHGAGGGAGSQAGAAAAFRRSKSMPAQLAALLTSAGYPARNDAFFAHIGQLNTPAELFAVYDNRVAFDGSAWVMSGSGRNTAGGWWPRNTTTTDRLYFTPVAPANTFDIYYEVFASGGGVVNVQDNTNTTVGTFNSAGASPTQMGKVTVTRPNTDTTSIRILASGVNIGIGIFAIVPYDTANPMIELWNMGRPGWTAGDWAADSVNYYASMNAIVQHAAKAYLINLGANDANTGVAVSTFKTNYQTLIDAVKAFATVRLVKTHGTIARNGTGYDPPASYRIAIDELVASNSLPSSIDFYNKANLVLADYFDGIHLAQSGYAKEAPLVLADMIN